MTSPSSGTQGSKKTFNRSKLINLFVQIDVYYIILCAFLEYLKYFTIEKQKFVYSLRK